jgi:hypothetical protein
VRALFRQAQRHNLNNYTLLGKTPLPFGTIGYLDRKNTPAGTPGSG